MHAGGVALTFLALAAQPASAAEANTTRPNNRIIPVGALV
jgi:hypothetical protein